jgi:autotransporter-associated beta strand protein
MVVGRGGRGLLNMTGGTLNANGAPMTIGTVNGTYVPGQIDGQVNLSGGVINVVAQEVYVAESQNGVLNVSGSGHLLPGVDVRLATNSNATGILNLATGGTVQTPLLRQGNGRAILNFHGGTLAPTADNNTTFLGGITGTATTGSFNAYVYPEGAVFDSSGHSITVSQPLLAPTGNGVSAAGLTVSGSGFIGAPIVDITGGGGIGATANATVDSSGNLTGIVITNPGVGYTSAPTFTLQGGGLGNTGAISGTATLVANTSGAVNKIGTGTLTLSGANTYTGNTIVSGGTLVLGSATALPANTNLALHGGTFSTLGTVQALTTNKLVANGSGAIDLVGGGSLSFADSSSLSSSWNGAISILHWNGTPNTASATDPIFVGTNTAGLTASQLQSIHFGRNGATAYNGATLLSTGEVVPTGLSTRVLGDFNLSGAVTSADIPAMLTALTDLNSYKTSHSVTNDDVLNVGDVNGDGVVSNADIQAELDLVAGLGTGATAAVPEPETFVLLLLGAIPGLMIARAWRKNSAEKAQQA